MALPALPTYPLPDGEVTSQWEPNVEVLQFGDGYSQRFVRGINAEKTTYTMNYTNLTQAERNIIYNFIKARKGGEAFTWQWLTDAAPRKYICTSGITEARRNGEIYDLSFEMEEVHDI